MMMFTLSLKGGFSDRFSGSAVREIENRTVHEALLTSTEKVQRYNSVML